MLCLVTDKNRKVQNKGIRTKYQFPFRSRVSRMCGNNQEVLKSLFPLLTKKLFPLRLIAEIIQNLESRCCGERHWEGKAGEWKGETGPLTDCTLSKLHTESSLANMDCGVHSDLGTKGPHLETGLWSKTA